MDSGVDHHTPLDQTHVFQSSCGRGGVRGEVRGGGSGGGGEMGGVRGGGGGERGE